MLFGPVSSGASIVGNMIANVQATDGSAGTGIYFDGPDASGDSATATSNHTITGNVIKNCDGSAIANDKQNRNIVISGNIIENTNSVVSGAAIQLADAENIHGNHSGKIDRESNYELPGKRWRASETR